MSNGQSFSGRREHGPVIIFRNIPYAEPPTGIRRWKEPTIKTSYSGPIDGTKQGYACATVRSTDNPDDNGESEDCLHVNVSVAEWVLENKRKVPVVAYVHGGGHNGGTNGNPLHYLADQGLVVFNISYRLGPWGYLHLESTESGQSYRGNWGLLDQLTALKWISAYAGVFGGDKNQVTLDGCSSGTQSNWHHLTSPAAWPYFHRFASTGLGLPAGVYYEGQKTDLIRNTIFQKAKVNTIDQLRELSTGTLARYFEETLRELNPHIKQSPTLDPMYGPVIDFNYIPDHLIYLVRDGKIRPNTPISLTYAKDDAFEFSREAYDYFYMVKEPQFEREVRQAQRETGFKSPPPYQNLIFEASYPNQADQMNEIFGCKSLAWFYSRYINNDCYDEFARWVQASHWYCTTRWALNGALKANPEAFGAIYPMEFRVPNCDEKDGQPTKTCHCSEARWIQGGMGYTGDLGKRMRDVWHEFYLNGRFDSQEIKSWQQMSFDQFNVIGEDEWGQDQILGWSECKILDELQNEMNEYTWGYTLETQNGPQK